MTERYPHLFQGKAASAEPPFRVTLSALPAPEYDLIVNQWPLARLYVWLLARHADSFGSAVQKAIAEFHKSTSPN